MKKRSLETVSIGKGLEHVVIGRRGAFNDCVKLKEINVSELNENYTSINGVFFDKNVTSLIQYPAEKAYTSYSVPDSVTYIGECAFNNCASLERIEIPDSVAAIEGFRGTFLGASLAEINVSPQNQNYSSLDGVLFDKPKATLIQYPAGKKDLSYSIPGSVTSVDYYAFKDCTSLENVTIPESVSEGLSFQVASS